MKPLKITELLGGAEMHVAGLIFNPTFSKILVVNNQPYKGKGPGAGFPGGRTSTLALIELLLNILHNYKEPWSKMLDRLFVHNNHEDLEEILEDLAWLAQKESIQWDDIDYGVREMLIREKLCIETKDETGLEKEEVTILNFLSVDPAIYTNLVSDDPKRYEEKIVHRFWYFCMTDATGIPRKHYKKEVDESRWFDVFNLPAYMYRSHREILLQMVEPSKKIILQPEVGYLIERWRKRYAPSTPVRESNYKTLFEGMGRE